MPPNSDRFALLTEHGVAFREVEHAPTYTSEESAAARGEELGVGAKELLIKTDDVFRLFVLAADRKLDSAAIKRELAQKDPLRDAGRAAGIDGIGAWVGAAVRSADSAVRVVRR